MSRVKACAILFLDSSRRDKIAEIADNQGITLDDAAIVYTLGALKRAKRQGTASTYNQALDNLEAEQVGDRGNPLARTLQADNISRHIDKINRINAGDKIVIDGVQYVHDYDTIIMGTTIPHYTVIDNGKQQQQRKVGKVLGTLYARWQEQTDKTDPHSVLEQNESDKRRARVKENLRLFFADYKARLSPTSQKRLEELVENRIDSKVLMGKGLSSDDKQLKRDSWGAYTLYDNFPHKDSVSGCDFIDLVREYIPS
jgi:hypothetical protein